MKNPLQQTSAHSSPINQSRHSLALRRRAEEQVVCAILHASSPFGIYALAASTVVWTTQRSRSRFIASQSLQALLFQAVVFVASLIIFGIFAAGFLFAAFSGLIAQTGVNQPVLTSILIGAWTFGMVSVFFVTSVLPLWGVWAGIQILRGRNFRYPILAKYAIKWGPAKDTENQPQPRILFGAEGISSSDKLLAGISHLSMLAGFGPILGPILWATNKHHSSFLSYQVLQASLFQLMMAGIAVGAFVGLWGGSILLALLGGGSMTRMFDVIMCLGGIFMLTFGISVLVAAVQTFRGQEFSYPIIGKWLAHYLNNNQLK